MKHNLLFISILLFTLILISPVRAAMVFCPPPTHEVCQGGERYSQELGFNVCNGEIICELPSVYYIIFGVIIIVIILIIWKLFSRFFRVERKEKK